MGFIDGYEYAAKTTILEPGEVLFLYTDGLTEALNSDDEEYGEEPVRLSLTEAANEANLSRPVVMQVRSQMAEHVAGAEQYDDIIILAYRQPENIGDWDTCSEDSAVESGDSVLESFSVDSQSMEFFSLSDLKNGKE